MYIQSFVDVLDEKIISSFETYLHNNTGIVRKNRKFLSTHYDVLDNSLISQLHTVVKKLYKNSLIQAENSNINYLSIINLAKYQYINSWNFLDQINSRPSTLTLIGKLSRSSNAVSVEFIEDGKIHITDNMFLIFPSSFTHAFRINPIQSNEEKLLIGSILCKK